MKFSFYIAKRYLFSKKSHNAINWITGISVGVIAVVTMALVIVMSVMNGMSDMVQGLYTSFDPSIKITPKKGKHFSPSLISIDALRANQNIEHIVPVLEDIILVKNDVSQEIAHLKGVGDEFDEMTGLVRDGLINRGSYKLQSGKYEFAVIGSLLGYKLDVIYENPLNALNLFMPKKGKSKGSAFDTDFFNEVRVVPSGSFRISDDFDGKYILTSLKTAEKLFEYNGEISAYEIGLKNDEIGDETKAEIQEIVGDGFDVKTRLELNEFLFKSIKSEKWMAMMLLCCILIIAVFNIICSLTMLIIDKSKDIFVLKSMGASNKLIKSLFWTEGTLISLFGSGVGLTLGILACLIQIYFKPLSLPPNFIIDAYPVEIQLLDLVYIKLIVVGIGVVAAYIPARKSYLKATKTS